MEIATSAEEIEVRGQISEVKEEEILAVEAEQSIQPKDRTSPTTTVVAQQEVNKDETKTSHQPSKITQSQPNGTLHSKHKV